MKSTTILGMVVMVLVVAGLLMFVNGRSATGNVVNDNPPVLGGEVQQVTISERDYNYYPREITVSADKPVSITLDSSVSGCLRSFTIKDLGVQEYSRKPSETIDFTPTKKGTFTYACSMGMGFGTIKVV